MALKWNKKLTKSDAQQKTLGAKMPFLRFTAGDSGKDHTTWFRNTFFDNLNWGKATSNKGRPIERAKINIRVVVLGNDLGSRTMDLDYDPARAKNHRAPTVHLHYDNKTRQLLESLKQLVGRKVVVTRDNNDDYTFEVQ